MAPAFSCDELFYIGAALCLDLDSDEVDAILAGSGLALEKDGIEVCRNTIRAAVGEEVWRRARTASLALDNQREM